MCQERRVEERRREDNVPREESRGEEESRECAKRERRVKSTN